MSSFQVNVQMWNVYDIKTSEVSICSNLLSMKNSTLYNFRKKCVRSRIL